MKVRLILYVCCLCVMYSSMGTAEVYKWVDQSGVTHFTDDLSKVPKEQRPGMDAYKGIEPEKEEVPEPAPVDKNKLLAQALITEKKLLDEEFDVLIKEKQLLSDQKATLGIKEYNQKAELLNARIQAYQKKAADYERRANEYNSLVQAAVKTQ